MSKLASQGYVVKPLDADTFADVERLHYAVYGKHPARGYFSRKYDTRFTGVQYVGFLAYAKQVPVAFYGVLPCLMDVDGEPILVAQSADTMTHPEHRNRGLFVELAELTFQRCKDAHIRLLFGFPNQNSLPGFVGKLGWQSPTTLDYFVIRAGKAPFIGWAGRLPLLRGMLARYRRSVLGRYRDAGMVVKNSVVGDGFCGIRRDDAWARYKTYSETRVIRIAGSRLWIKLGSFIQIGDMEVAPEDFEQVLVGIKKLARALAVRDIYFHACPGTTLHALFARHGEPMSGFPVIFHVLGEALPIDRIKFTSADLDIF